ncbi:T9SS type A sorting domain-containing protein [Salibacter halophilus]|uniref:T9SS type A sorting domain-containing protein n=1 Tax=Salibacter halophilus TaxID=1803916 RepID=A0A6N6M727_9FLAO|nr:T9SS type A sorting domain-containing protein [Salibacter halophilus]KAB1063827.1 T9SS type A sorting domain-containing protein [Salibacter halophilus]
MLIHWNQGKFFFSLFICFSFSIGAKSQCIADAGNDTIICWGSFMRSNDSLFLGGENPAITGYTYKWEVDDAFTASIVLDDTTKANPMIENWWGGEPFDFYLTVIDSVGNICRDTVTVAYCQYVLSAFDVRYFINEGDSVQIGGSFDFNYQNPHCGDLQVLGWSPNYAISDTLASRPIVWPDTNVWYGVNVEDSCSCQVPTHINKVYVTPTGYDERTKNNGKVNIHPNPFSSITTFTFHDRSLKTLEVYDNAGKQVRVENINSNRTEFNRKELKPGVYFFRVFDSNRELIDRGKLVITD